MKTNYLRQLYSLPDICAQFRREMIRDFFTSSDGRTADYQSNEFYCYTPKYRDYQDIIVRSVEICDLLGIQALEFQKSRLTEHAHGLGNPRSVRERKNFELHIAYIANTFSEVRSTIVESVNRLDAREIERLDEALHCFLEGCYFSTVAMAVTAIEFRLLQWMKKVNPDESNKLDELTLGQLLSTCLNEQRYNNLLPKKYHPLLELCNEYRVFSVHAKSEQINKRLASSILGLSMEFLFDRSLIETPK